MGALSEEARVVARAVGVHVRMIDKFLLMALPSSITLVTVVDDAWMGWILSTMRYTNALMVTGIGIGRKADVTIEATAREPAFAGWWFGRSVEELSGLLPRTARA